jgi:hypothetical protein
MNALRKQIKNITIVVECDYWDFSIIAVLAAVDSLDRKFLKTLVH